MLSNNKILKKAFYAYASEPNNVAQSISEAIKSINNNSEEYSIQISDWQELNIIGKPIIRQICTRINDSDLVICDLTTDNENVLFELGYAIAKNKQIWITLCPDFHDAEDRYKNLRSLTTVGYLPYRNHYELTAKLLQNLGNLDKDDTILSHTTNDYQNKDNYIFYLKSKAISPASKELTKTLRSETLPVIIDDPNEGSSQALDWYVKHTFFATAIVAHFSANLHSERNSSDVKYALACGLAFGFDKPVRMLVEKPYITPIDYRDIAIEYSTPLECSRGYTNWIQDIRAHVSTVQESRTQRFHAIDSVKHVDIGFWLAENEEENLTEYFVETASYREAINSRDYVLFLGRKGTGKTANLLKIAQKLDEDNRNHTCVIRPLEIEFESLLQLFNLSSSIANTGYLIGSIWKFLVYTELAYSVYHSLLNRPVHFMRKNIEDDLIEFVEDNGKLIKSDFAERLEYAITNICEMDVYKGTPEERNSVSEKLHENVIGILRKMLGEILSEKYRVTILIDNLDKGWKHRPDLPILSDFLFGLLSVGRQISDDFSRRKLRKEKINISLIIFLRSDIFSYIKLHAREADKLQYSQINWDDSRLLKRLIEERFSYSLNKRLLPEEVWGTYFCESIMDIPTSDYIISRIVPRPRDMIYFCKSALANAQNHNHEKIEKIDIFQAEEDYSRFALSLLDTELSKEFPNIENLVIYKFIGESEIVTYQTILNLLDNSDVDEADYHRLIELLVENLFFGIETDNNEFTFLYDDKNRGKNEQKANMLQGNEQERRYRIHPAFHKHLEIQPTY